jgi:hypothetical protein
MMSADSVAFHRVLIAAASRFPALVSRTFDHTIGPFSALTVRHYRSAERYRSGSVGLPWTRISKYSAQT